MFQPVCQPCFRQGPAPLKPRKQAWGGPPSHGLVPDRHVPPRVSYMMGGACAAMWLACCRIVRWNDASLFAGTTHHRSLERRIIVRWSDASLFVGATHHRSFGRWMLCSWWRWMEQPSRHFGVWDIVRVGVVCDWPLGDRSCLSGSLASYVSAKAQLP